MRRLALALALGALGTALLGPVARAAETEGWTVALAARDVLTPPSRTMLATSVTDDRTGSDWDWVDRSPLPEAVGKKSTFKAVASSALLPGLGEQYLGYPTRAKVFYAMEGVIWASFAFFQVQGDNREDTQIEYAQLNAEASPEGDSDYYEHIGLWLSIDEWHDIVRRDARFRFPDDPDAQAQFFEQNKRYDQGDYWAWASDGDRIEYRQLRSQSERSYRNSRISLGAAIINRLVSMIDSLALARAYNRRYEEEQARIDLRLRPESTGAGLVVGPVLTARY